MSNTTAASLDSRLEDIVTGLICAVKLLNVVKTATYEEQASYDVIADSLHCLSDYLEIYTERLDKLNMEARKLLQAGYTAPTNHQTGGNTHD